MSTIPQSYPAAIDWCTNHLADWPADPTTIGLDAARVLELAGRTQAASQALADAQQLDNQKKAAFEAYHAAAKSMRDYASQSVGIIRGFAKGSDNPEAVYTAALIPAPADPAPAAEPGVPFNFKTRLLQSGALELAFDCDNQGEGGVTYAVSRRDNTGQGASFQFVMNALERKFVDATIPQGTPSVTYSIVGTRSTGLGEPAQTTINFGSGNSAEVVLAA